MKCHSSLVHGQVHLPCKTELSSLDAPLDLPFDLPFDSSLNAPLDSSANW